MKLPMQLQIIEIIIPCTILNHATMFQVLLVAAQCVPQDNCVHYCAELIKYMLQKFSMIHTNVLETGNDIPRTYRDAFWDR